MEKFEEIKALIEACTEDVDKFYVKGNKAAAVRIRKTLLPVIRLYYKVITSYYKSIIFYYPSLVCITK